MELKLQLQLQQLIKSVPELMETAEACRDVGLPNFYIAGGAITQLIWNSLGEKELLDKVKDFDIVYFDESNAVSEELFELSITKRIRHSVEVDLKNQATMHERYLQRFGCSIAAYVSVEQGIESWLPAFAIGFTLDSYGDLAIYAPYGLEDAFDMLVKPNKRAMTEACYNKMTTGYKARWPKVKVYPWG
ncbi:nucleotidyltransferase family protein [Moritella sp. 5]|uniref:nucleotidyltransferase family protein n=1 Tax=Moritella sp. 5 TaxID=2746231 RepID=UPI001BA53396|nr:nucleotidyltransferase family protein [Moritella sp. 5]QUM80425.1 nucleotidyltransferase family protein [Moritella sp. 5]